MQDLKQERKAKMHSEAQSSKIQGSCKESSLLQNVSSIFFVFFFEKGWKQKIALSGSAAPNVEIEFVCLAQVTVHR